MNKNVLLAVGVALMAIGLFKPNLESWIKPVHVDDSVVVVVDKPTNKDLQTLTVDVIESLQNGGSDRKQDGVKLAQLYNDLATLISLSGEDVVIKNTDEIRQANSLAGLMLKMDMKGKYSNLAKACTNLVTSVIGDDSVSLNDDLRAKSVEAFKALSWACNEGSK